MPIRSLSITRDFLRSAPSCLIEMGGTRVLCTATIEESVPPFLRGTGKGWLTAEYAMLPASTGSRKRRDGVSRDGRGVEISRLIGRSLRQAIDLTRLGERTIAIDCDVLEADGGTRTASITGGFVALCLSIEKLLSQRKLYDSPIVRQVAAVSVGIVLGEPVLDLCYAQDSRADVDMNVVMDAKGNFIEVQGTGEGAVFPRDALNTLLDLAAEGIASLQKAQLDVLGDAATTLIGALPRLIVASGNAHKVTELRAMLAGHYSVLSLADVGLTLDVEETGDTFAENACLKADYICKRTRCAALADDSGLVVDALGGAPGVHSARYCGVHGDDAANNRLLLANLKGHEKPLTARFVSAVALAVPLKETKVFEGKVEGTILDAPRGDGGFGYDPLFAYADGRTFGEMPDADKNAISHRANAVKALLAWLEGGAC